MCGDLAGSKIGFHYLGVSLGLESMSCTQVRERADMAEKCSAFS